MTATDINIPDTTTTSYKTYAITITGSIELVRFGRELLSFVFGIQSGRHDEHGTSRFADIDKEGLVKCGRDRIIPRVLGSDDFNAYIQTGLNESFDADPTGSITMSFYTMPTDVFESIKARIDKFAQLEEIETVHIHEITLTSIEKTTSTTTTRIA